MERQDIEHNLCLLGEQLEELGPLSKPIRLLMIGGGFMLTQVGNRQTTRDIDVMVRGISDPQHSDDYRIFKNAVRFVAYDAGLHEAWLSDTISDFLTIAGSVPKKYILAHKLVAGRDKDLDDISRSSPILLVRVGHVKARRCREQGQSLDRSVVARKGSDQAEAY